MYSHHHIGINAEYCIVFIIQAIFCILLFCAATTAARPTYSATVAISIASAAGATTTAATVISTLAAVAQGRAPDKEIWVQVPSAANMASINLRSIVGHISTDLLHQICVESHQIRYHISDEQPSGFL